MPEFLHDAYHFQFKDLVLHQALKGWQDKIAFRNAVHEYLNRPGAEIEAMARKPAEFNFSCFYLGPTWRDQYKALVDSLDESNKGPLIHPLLGEFPAAVDMLTSTSTPGTGRNLVEFQLQVTEDRVDTRLAAQGRPTPQQAAAAVTEKQDALTTSTASFTQSQSKIEAFQDAATNYTTLALAAATGYVIDPAVPALLVQIGALADAAEQALLADPLNVADAALYPQLMAVEQLYAACLDLDDAVRAVRPLPETFRVQVAGPLLTMCQRWYGGPAALEYMAVIESLNRIANPGWVPSGFELLRPPPTIPGT